METISSIDTFLIVMCSTIFLIATFVYIIHKKTSAKWAKRGLEKELAWKECQSKPKFRIVGFVAETDGQNWVLGNPVEPSRYGYRCELRDSETVALALAVKAFKDGYILLGSQIYPIDTFELLEVVQEDKEPHYVL